MIAFLEGDIFEIEPTHVIIACGGVGYKVSISLNTFEKIKGKKALRINTYLLVREDAQLLYGFAESEEQRMFELLLSVSGVGANTALTMLSSLTTDALAQAISSEDLATLKQVKGIGAKSAGRIVLDLKDKVGAAQGGSGTSALGSRGKLREDAVMGLLSLGFAKSEAERRVDNIMKDTFAPDNSAEIIRLALRN